MHSNGFDGLFRTVDDAFGRSRIERAVMPRGAAAKVADAWRLRQRELAAMSPLGELVELADSGHYVPFDRPDTIADAVLTVLGDGRADGGKPATH